MLSFNVNELFGVMNSPLNKVAIFPTAPLPPPKALSIPSSVISSPSPTFIPPKVVLLAIGSSVIPPLPPVALITPFSIVILFPGVSVSCLVDSTCVNCSVVASPSILGIVGLLLKSL